MTRPLQVKPGFVSPGVVILQSSVRTTVMLHVPSCAYAASPVCQYIPRLRYQSDLRYESRMVELYVRGHTARITNWECVHAKQCNTKEERCMCSN